MSTGIVICSVCLREVHQDGPASTWTHCEDKSSRCIGASSRYPTSTDEIVGQWCGADGQAEPEKSTTRPVAVVSDYPRLGLMSAAAALAVPFDRPLILRAPPAAAPRREPHQGARERARRRRQLARREGVA